MRASINGITVSNLKLWDTHDGGGMQGNIVLGGNIIGRLHDDGNGGEMDIHILDTAEADFNRRVASYFKANPSEYPTADIFLEELVNHTDNLKHFKRGMAKGFTIFALLWRAPRNETMYDGHYINQPTQVMYKSEAGLTQDVVAKGFKDWQTFTKLEDFIINTMDMI